MYWTEATEPRHLFMVIYMPGGDARYYCLIGGNNISVGTITMWVQEAFAINFEWRPATRKEKETEDFTQLRLNRKS